MIALMTVAAIAAASGMAAPQLPRRPVIRFTDYPGAAVARGEQGAAVLRLLIDPNGKPRACEVDEIIGTDFSSIFCAHLMRARFTPARDGQGQPSYGVWRGALSFFLPDHSSEIRYPVEGPPDLGVRLTAEQAHAEMPSQLEFIVRIGITGGIEECEPKTEADVAAWPALCDELKRSAWRDQVRYDGRGDALSYVRRIKVALLSPTPETSHVRPPDKVGYKSLVAET